MALALGDCFTLILTEGGALYGLGRNEEGMLGCINQDEQQNTPSRIRWSQWTDDLPALVFAGRDHLACVTKQGSLYMWGSAANGRLGLSVESGAVQVVHTPTMVPIASTSGSEREIVLMAACSDTFSLALTQNGKVFSCGDGPLGQLGLGGATLSTPVMTWIQHHPFQEVKVTMIAAGVSHCVALAQGNARDLWTWGSNIQGQLGLGDREERTIPTPVETNTFGIRCTAVFAGGDSTAMISDNEQQNRKGQLWTCGSGTSGELGLGVYGNVDDFRLVGGDAVFGEKGVRTAGMGLGHMIVLTHNNKVFSWGRGAQAQLGQPLMDSKRSPSEVVLELPDGDFVKVVAAGSYHQAIITNDGTAYVWGTWRNLEARALYLPGKTRPHEEQRAQSKPRGELGGERAGRWHVELCDLFHTFSMGSRSPKSWENSPRSPRPSSPVMLLDRDHMAAIQGAFRRLTFEPNQHCSDGLRYLMGFGPK